MKKLFETIVAPLVVAGIIGNVAIWFRVEQKFSVLSERLARIETKLDVQAGKTTAKNYVNLP